MNKRKKRLVKFAKYLLILLAVGLISYWSYSIYNRKSALKIISSPDALVYLDGEKIGKTPLELETKETNVEIKLVPEIFSEEDIFHKTEIELTKGVKTIYDYSFASSRKDSEAVLLSFTKAGYSRAALAVVSIPDGVSVYLDGEPLGVTPLRVDGLKETVYNLRLEAEGYNEKKLTVSPRHGYLLTAYVELSLGQERVDSIVDKISSNEEQVEETVQIPILPRVKILDTPTSFLRVRENPLLSSREISRVYPGQEYVLEDEVDDWYKIQLSASQSGFISKEYASASGRTQTQQ